MGEDPTALLEDRSEWPTFLSRGQLLKVGDPDPEGAGEGEGEVMGIWLHHRMCWGMG